MTTTCPPTWFAFSRASLRVLQDILFVSRSGPLQQQVFSRFTRPCVSSSVVGCAGHRYESNCCGPCRHANIAGLLLACPIGSFTEKRRAIKAKRYATPAAADRQKDPLSTLRKRQRKKISPEEGETFLCINISFLYFGCFCLFSSCGSLLSSEWAVLGEGSQLKVKKKKSYSYSFLITLIASQYEQVSAVIM